SGGAGGPGEPNGLDGSESAAGGGSGGTGGAGAPGEAGGGGGSGSARGSAPQPPAGEPGGGTGESPTPGSPHKRARDAGPKTGSETGIGSPVPETVDASRLRSLDNVSVEEAAKYAGDGRVKDLRRDFGGEKGKDAAAAGGAPSAPKGRFDPGRAAKGPDGGPDVDREKSGASGKGGSPEADVARKLRTLSREYRDLAEQYLKRMRGR
ncbi:MAG: hypothetical protein N3A38_17225, partial [Planctomycetota bacterium]|nr:hypothetical protein [Planctomycetota bacterium]